MHSGNNWNRRARIHYCEWVGVENMPVTYGTFTKQLKLLPLVLQANGGANVTVRYGYVGDDGEFTGSSEQQFQIYP
jgi:hypothetical protein